MHHGNPGHKAVVRHVLSLACTPIYVMLTQWLLDGTLEDPHHEFFIASDPTVPDDKLWQDKYSIRYAICCFDYVYLNVHPCDPEFLSYILEDLKIIIIFIPVWLLFWPHCHCL